MDELSIQATLDKLSRGYPEIIATIPHATDFPVRGLLIDKRFGNILKMDRYKTSGRATTASASSRTTSSAPSTTRRRSAPRPRATTGSTRSTRSARPASTRRSSRRSRRAGYAVDYARVFADIRESIDEAHRDGTILNAVLGDASSSSDPELAPTLHKLRSAGKKLFLLTNSRWSYTDAMMNYLLGGAMAEYPTWRNYFDVVIVAATKPAFFQERRPLRRPLMERDGEEVRPATFPLERGKSSTRGATSTTSSARSASRATRCSTSATTSTATSFAPRRRAPGARR
jgi:5'-nucleotidase